MKHWHLGAQSCAEDTHLFYGLLLPFHFIWLHGNSMCFLYYTYFLFTTYYFVFSLSFNISLVIKPFTSYLHHKSIIQTLYFLTLHELIFLCFSYFFFATDTCFNVTIQFLHKHANSTNIQWSNWRPDADICLPLLYISHRYYQPMSFSYAV